MSCILIHGVYVKDTYLCLEELVLNPNCSRDEPDLSPTNFICVMEDMKAWVSVKRMHSLGKWTWKNQGATD